MIIANRFRSIVFLTAVATIGNFCNAAPSSDNEMIDAFLTARQFKGLPRMPLVYPLQIINHGDAYFISDSEGKILNMEIDQFSLFPEFIACTTMTNFCSSCSAFILHSSGEIECYTNLTEFYSILQKLENNASIDWTSVAAALNDFISGKSITTILDGQVWANAASHFSNHEVFFFSNSSFLTISTNIVVFTVGKPYPQRRILSFYNPNFSKAIQCLLFTQEIDLDVSVQCREISAASTSCWQIVPPEKNMKHLFVPARGRLEISLSINPNYRPSSRIDAGSLDLVCLQQISPAGNQRTDHIKIQFLSNSGLNLLQTAPDRQDIIDEEESNSNQGVE